LRNSGEERDGSESQQGALNCGLALGRVIATPNYATHRKSQIGKISDVAQFETMIPFQITKFVPKTISIAQNLIIEHQKLSQLESHPKN
jgi:riboflavin transporter FmnP